MRINPLIAAIAGAIIAGTSTYVYLQKNPQNTTSTDEKKHVQLHLNSPQEGMISSASLVSPSDGVRSEVYEFTSKEDQYIQVDVNGLLPAQITILQRGYVVERSLDSASCSSNECREAQGEDPSLLFKARKNTTYQIAVSGVNDRSYGPYQVLAKGIVPYDGKPIAIGQPITDWGLGQPNHYPLVIEEAGIYIIDMVAYNQSLDGYLQLKLNGENIATDDDSGNNLDPKIRQYLEPGNYTLYASSAVENHNFKGSYKIQIHKQPVDLSNLDLDPNGGELVFADTPQKGMYLQKEQAFSFQLDQPKILQVQMDSSQLNALLQVGPFSTRLNNGNEDTILRVALDAGEHELRISSEQAGPFQLTATLEDLPSHVTIPSLKQGEAKHFNLHLGVNAIALPLTITEAGQYRIYMESDRIDTYLQLLRDQKTIASDDDSGGDLNALIEEWLEPGEYQVIATAIGGLPASAQFSVLVEKD